MSEAKRGSLSLRPSELVIAAIHSLEEKKGSTSSDIINFISDKYDIKSQKVRSQVEKALKRGVSFGVLSENGGYYQLLDMRVPRITTNVMKNKMKVNTKRSTIKAVKDYKKISQRLKKRKSNKKSPVNITPKYNLLKMRKDSKRKKPHQNKRNQRRQRKPKKWGI